MRIARVGGRLVVMPLVEVVHDQRVPADVLRALAGALPDAVSVAVECPEEPYDHDLRPGDVDIRFRERGPLDSGGLAIVVEVRSKWFESRAVDRQDRCANLCARLADVAGDIPLGVYLTLPVAAWDQID